MRTKAYRRHQYRVHQERWRQAAANGYDPMRGWYDTTKQRMVESPDSTARVYLKRMSNKRYRHYTGITDHKKLTDIYWILY